jgi:hypothetical protein
VDDAGFILGGYAVTAVALAAYAVRVVLRGRRVTRALPPEERRWL